MIDLVYIYELGLSDFRERELLFSLRSVEKFMKNYRNIYIVGEVPPFINTDKIIHIPHVATANYKEHRIMEKFLRACRIPEISQKFLMMNDDYFLTENIDASKVPYYYQTSIFRKMMNRKPFDNYRLSIANTLGVLEEAGQHDPKYYDIHYPILYDKDLFPLIMESFDWTIKCAHIVKSLYCNLAEVKGKQRDDCKIMESLSERKTLEKISEFDLFSTSSITRGINAAFNKLYPEPSKYEI